MKPGKAGLMKDEEIYNIFDTAKLLNRPATVTVSNTSGLAGIAYWLNDHYKLTGSNAIDKKSPIVTFIKEAIDAEYAGGRQTVMATEELEDLVLRWTAKNQQNGEF